MDNWPVPNPNLPADKQDIDDIPEDYESSLSSNEVQDELEEEYVVHEFRREAAFWIIVILVMALFILNTLGVK